MLSVLIPTYNYNIVPLVQEIHRQALVYHLKFEILVYDDGSKSSLNTNNRSTNLLDECIFKELPNNIGRSAIRNLLGRDAKYDNLLFVDAGTYPEKKDFINNYMSLKNKKVIIGGMTYLEKPPKAPYKVRWLYTKKREYWLTESNIKNSVFCSSNFLIHKSVFNLHPFDESLKNYGYEDVLFFDTLSKNSIAIFSINNPVIHNADDDADTFILKTEAAIENLIYLINEKKLNYNSSGISGHYLKLKKIGLVVVIARVFKVFRLALKRNFNSRYPSILLFDFYRLGYFCLIKTKK